MAQLPVLRTDLIFQEQTVKNVTTVICKDPDKLTYYRFEEEEYFVLSKLDSKNSSQDIADAYNERFRDELSDKDIEEFVASLSKKNLFVKSKEEQNTYLYEKLKEQRRSKILQTKGSIMYFRVKIWNPNTFFNMVMPNLRWIWSPKFVTFMNLFMVSGLFVLFLNIKEVKLGIVHIFDFGEKNAVSLFLLWLTVMGTIMVHELGHGLTCKRFGGDCHEIGFLFMFLNPCMYANVNDAWMFTNKKHRLYVTFAGCYIEMMLGFICVYIWLFTQAGSTVNLMAFQIVVVAFFSAIFMNFNPLMKFDGYFALSDYLEIPNLRNRSQSYVKYIVQRYVFRLNRENEDILSKREQWLLFLYGSLVILYLINVFSGLGFMFGNILIQKFGIHLGIIFTCFLMYKLLGMYIKKTIGFILIFFKEKIHFFKQKPVLSVITILILTIVYVFIFIPFSQYIEFNTKLEPKKKVILRSLSNGYVENFEHPNKLEYKKDETLFKLRNFDLEEKIKTVTIDIRQNELKKQQALIDDDLVKLTETNKILKKLINTKKDLERQRKNLEIIAPFSGVLESPVSAFENTFIVQGQQLGTFIDPTLYKATISVMEREMEDVTIGTQANLIFDVQPEVMYNGNVTEISVLPKSEGLAKKYEITITFLNNNMLLRSGLVGMVSLKVRKATMLNSFIREFQKTIRLDLQI
ncbi:MAG: HlyD family efflux transporter periplasmic adaptor subunit [Chitinispirillia bacterium]|jgi:putative peptide zinc metalloprotease protein